LKLGPGDRVNITVFAQPDLTGDHTLDSQGNIELPIGGRIAAFSLTTAQLEQKITETLADGYIIRPSVSVRISELRPVYVLGDVHSAGAVAYRYGMSALIAIAMAGGSAYTQDSMAVRGDLLETEERLEVMRGQRTALRTRIVRLAAQRDGVASLAFPSNLQNGTPASLELLAGERAVFASEHDEEARQVALLAQQVADAKTEVASIAEQLRLAHQQSDSLSSYLIDLEKLARSGLVERRRVVDLQQEQARIQANVVQLGTQAVRAAQIIQEAPLRMSDARAAARRHALLSLQEANTRLAELDTGIEAARKLVAVRQQRVGAGDLARATDRQRLQVTRAGPDGSRTFEVQETTALLPGDIVRVSGGPDTRVFDTVLDQPPTAKLGEQ
jgi:polysaccharide export outer membrane protein